MDKRALHHRCCLALGVLMMQACASRDAGTEELPATRLGTTEAWSAAWLKQTALTPFADLNVIRDTIPPLLVQAQLNPYGLPYPARCVTFKEEIAALDLLLGADLDTAPTEQNPGLLQRGGSELNRAARRELQGAAADLIPYRSWIRRLSGADRYSREVEAAITAGAIRRAFLKGFASAQGCPASE